MSLKNSKAILETYLDSNISNVAIKWNNTSTYVLNGVKLTQAQVDALTFFIAPKIIPISNEREIISGTTPFKTKLFFQIDIYNKIGAGSGKVYSTIETLDSLFREKTISNLICLRTNTINSFDSGDFTITPHRIVCQLWN